jgi:hypothetical protein
MAGEYGGKPAGDNFQISSDNLNRVNTYCYDAAGNLLIEAQYAPHGGLTSARCRWRLGPSVAGAGAIEVVNPVWQTRPDWGTHIRVAWALFGPPARFYDVQLVGTDSKFRISGTFATPIPAVALSPFASAAEKQAAQDTQKNQFHVDKVEPK